MPRCRPCWLWPLLFLSLGTQCGKIQLGGHQKGGGAGGDLSSSSRGGTAGSPSFGGGGDVQGGHHAGGTGGSAGSASEQAGGRGGAGGNAAAAGATIAGGGSISMGGGATTAGQSASGAAGRVAQGGITAIGGTRGAGGSPGAAGTGGTAGAGGMIADGGAGAVGGGGGTGAVGGAGSTGYGGSAGHGGAGGNTTPCRVQLGDVDGDGDVDAEDSSQIIRSLSGQSLAYREAADVDCDGSITEADAVCVSNLAGSFIQAFRCNFSTGIGAGTVGNRTCGLRTGDLDANGVVDDTDAVRALQFGVCNEVPMYWIVADVNCDGGIDPVDALMIAQAAAGTHQLAACGDTGGSGESGTAGSGGEAGTASQGGQACVPATAGAGGAGGQPGALKRGDVNGDGIVNLVDADAVALYAQNQSCPVAPFYGEVADVNCDCKIDVWDAKQIAAYVQCARKSLDCAGQ